jgi:hypothetical protein
VRKESALDLEALEIFIRSQSLDFGATILQKALEGVGEGRRDEPLVCANNHLPCRMESQGRQTKTVRTVLGPISFTRSTFRCPQCGAIRHPGDEALGVIGTGFSPGVRRMMARAGSQESFEMASQDLHFYARVEAGAKDVERMAEKTGAQVADWMARQASLALGSPAACEPVEPQQTLYVSFDGTGIPMRGSELRGVKGKGEDGRAHTREVKLGCVFTQTKLDTQGFPERDPASTTFVGAIESSADFGNRLHAEAVRRGVRQASRVVALTDGAAYNKTIIAEHFPHATHVIDLYHAREHLTEFIRDAARQPVHGALHLACQTLLDAGDIETLATTLLGTLPRSGPRRTNGEKKIRYFTSNATQMRYATFRAQGFFVGSGVIEAGCKTVIGRRLKQSGMFWTVRGANEIIALRCCLYSNRLEQFWEDMAA